HIGSLTPLSHHFSFFSYSHVVHRALHSFPTRRSSDLSGCTDRGRATPARKKRCCSRPIAHSRRAAAVRARARRRQALGALALERSEEHTSELQSRSDLVCRLLLEKKKKK